MGYPTEIPNSIPRPRPVPVRDPVTALVHRVMEGWRALRQRRRRRLADDPGRYRQGVDPRWRPIEGGDSRRLDVEEVRRSLGDDEVMP